MADSPLEPKIAEWLAAGVIDAAAAERLRAHEAMQPPADAGSRWPVLLALAFGGLMIGAAALLFVSAHWDAIRPATRLGITLLLVTIFHVAGAFAAGRFQALSVTLHAVGTVALGGGIAMAGQIFNLEEHWPAAILMWAAGATGGWLLLKQWPQALILAALAPAWLAGEYQVAFEHHYPKVTAVGLLITAVAYIGARRVDKDTLERRALAWLGALAILPLSLLAIIEKTPTETTLLGGVLAAFAIPIGFAALMRGKAAWMPAVLALWVIAAIPLANEGSLARHIWAAVFAVGVAVWGVLEARPERINLGAAGFAITVMTFYFSSIFDKLGRAASLLVLGLLSLGGGWLLERARRSLIARTRGEL